MFLDEASPRYISRILLSQDIKARPIYFIGCTTASKQQTEFGSFPTANQDGLPLDLAVGLLWGELAT